MLHPLQTSLAEVPQSVRHRIILGPSNSIPGCIPRRKKKNTHLHKKVYLNIHRLFVIVKKWEQPKCPRADEWTHKLWFIHAMECSAIKRNEALMPISTWIM